MLYDDEIRKEYSLASSRTKEIATTLPPSDSISALFPKSTLVLVELYAIGIDGPSSNFPVVVSVTTTVMAPPPDASQFSHRYFGMDGPDKLNGLVTSTPG
eukprot:COSAG01_NODE_6018_length_3899_cov_14.690263_3_plen_100_part_00